MKEFVLFELNSIEWKLFMLWKCYVADALLSLQKKINVDKWPISLGHFMVCNLLMILKNKRKKKGAKKNHRVWDTTYFSQLLKEDKPENVLLVYR